VYDQFRTPIIDDIAVAVVGGLSSTTNFPNFDVLRTVD
jgi:hypothetical protein